MLAQEYIRSRLDYDGETGVFTWLPIIESDAWKAYWNRQFAGRIAGSLHKTGYVRINIGCVTYTAHKLAWVYVNGDIPPSFEIDHIDRNRSNNRIENLRLATRQQNSRNKKVPKNNTSGVLGVVWNAGCNKWQAQIESNGKSVYLGLHASIEFAVEARVNAARSIFGKWAGETP